MCSGSHKQMDCRISLASVVSLCEAVKTSSGGPGITIERSSLSAAIEEAGQKHSLCRTASVAIPVNKTEYQSVRKSWVKNFLLETLPHGEALNGHHKHGHSDNGEDLVTLLQTDAIHRIEGQVPPWDPCGSAESNDSCCGAGEIRNAASALTSLSLSSALSKTSRCYGDVRPCQHGVKKVRSRSVREPVADMTSAPAPKPRSLSFDAAVGITRDCIGLELRGCSTKDKARCRTSSSTSTDDGLGSSAGSSESIDVPQHCKRKHKHKLFRCMWRGCNKQFTALSAILSHVRDNHIGFSSESGEEDFYFDDVTDGFASSQKVGGRKISSDESSTEGKPKSKYARPVVKRTDRRREDKMATSQPPQSVFNTRMVLQDRKKPRTGKQRNRSYTTTSALEVSFIKDGSQLTVKDISSVDLGSSDAQHGLGSSIGVAALTPDTPPFMRNPAPTGIYLENSSITVAPFGMCPSKISLSVEEDACEGHANVHLGDRLNEEYALRESQDSKSERLADPINFLGQESLIKKCRKVYGMDKRHLWCTQCKWKKACTRF